jgi:uncharacterized protein (TIGR02284 family)
MRNDEVVDTLNELIQTCEDGALGFRACADDVNDLQLKTFFANRAQSCAAASLELQELVRAYGGEPATGGGWGGTLHRRWIDIRALISGRGDRAVLEECERGEDVALASYRRAIDKRLPDDVRAVVERQLQGVVRNHDQVHSLRDRHRDI